MKKVIYILLFITGFIYSQQPAQMGIVSIEDSEPKTTPQQLVKITTQGLYKVIVNGDTVSKHTYQQKAVERYLNEKINNSKADVKVLFPDQLRLEFEGILNIQGPEIDTITISGSWHLTGENGNYFRYPNCGDIIKIKTDTVFKWQKDIEVIREKTFGKTNYKTTEVVPFQFVMDTITRVPQSTSYKWQTFATQHHCIKTYVDNVYTGDADVSCNPGNIQYHGYKLYRHTNQIDNLQPNTEYKIRVEGTTENGEYNIMEFIIKTLE